MVKTLAMYMRISLEDVDKRTNSAKDESNSIRSQRRLIQKHISENKEFVGYRVLEFIDDGCTGTNFDRQGFNNMIELVKKGEIGCIIVKDLSRFGRNYIEVGDYLEHIFPFLGIRIISINDYYDSNDYSGKTSGMDIAFRNLIYDYYSKDLSKKVKSAMGLKQKDAHYLSCVLYGYKPSESDKHQMVIDEEAAKVVRRIFAEIISGKTTTQVAKGLNDDGIPTPGQYKGIKYKRSQSHQWSHMRIHEMISNIKYTGTMVNHTRESRFIRDKSQRKCSPDEWIVRENAHEPIVTMEEFQAANEKIQRRKMSTKQILPTNDRVYVCAYCGRKLEKANGTVFACISHRFHEKSECVKVRFRKSIMEDVVFEALKAQLSLIKLSVRKSIPENKNKHTEIKRLLDSLFSEISSLDREKLELYEMYRFGDLTVEEYMEKKDRLMTKLDALKKRLSDTEEEYKNAVAQDNQNQEEEKKAIIIAKTNDEMLRSNMYEAIEKVVVYAPDKIEISWKFDDLFVALKH